MRVSIVTALVAALIALPTSGGAAEPVAEVAWIRHGFDEARALATADLTGDGADEIVVGGRGMAALTGDGLTTGLPAWTVKWNADPANPLDGGDNTWVTGMETVEMTGDGVPDLLVTTSDTDAYLVDGATGEKRWWNERTGGGLSDGLALIGGADGPPDLFPSGGTTAISGATGEPIWTAEAPPKSPKVVASGELDGEPGLDVVMAISPPGAGTDPTSVVGALTAPTVFAYTGAGELLYEYRAVKPVESVATADVNGDGVDEAIVGTYQGIVDAVGADGTAVWSAPTGLGSIDAIETADLDGNGSEDLIVGNAYGNNAAIDEFRVYAVSDLGATLWRHDVGMPVTDIHAANLDADDGPELLVGGGSHVSITGNRGVALALDPGVAGATELWRVGTAKTTMSFAVAEVRGEPTVVVGSADNTVRGVDPEGGEVRWRYHLGGYVKRTAAGDLDGDGASESATGDDEAQVIVTRADGSRAWSDRLPVGNDGQVSGLAFGDVDSDGADEVVAAGSRLFNDGDDGTLRLYESDGSVVWTRDLPWGVSGIRLRDLDGDGTPEIVIAEGGQTCGVRVLESADGATRWRTGITDCFSPNVDVGDIDGDGNPEIAYAEQNFFDEPWIALLEADGSVRWSTGILEASSWVRIVDGGFVHGGTATGSRGHVTRRLAAGGDVEWQTFFPKEHGRSGQSRAASVLPDVTGDGRADLAASTDQSDVRLIDGADGRELWRVPLEAPDTNPLHAHQAGPVTFVPGPQPFVVGAQWSIGRSRSVAAAIGLDASALGEVALEGEAWSASPVTLPGGRPGVVVGAGLGAYAIAAR